MGWVGLLKTILSGLLIVADIIRERQLLSAGEAKATAKALAVLAERLASGRQVADEVDRLTPEEIARELQT